MSARSSGLIASNVVSNTSWRIGSRPLVRCAASGACRTMIILIRKNCGEDGDMQGTSLDGRVAFVTGAARGLGQGICHALATARRRRDRHRPVGPRRDRGGGEGPRTPGRRPRVRRTRPGHARRRRPRGGGRARRARHHRRQRRHLDLVEVLGDARGPVADHDRREPHRRVAHVQGGHPHRSSSRIAVDRSSRSARSRV